MKKILLITTFLLSSLFTWAQVPANDNCSTATNLGTLPNPAACPSGVGTAVNVTNQTNIGATAPSPYTTLLGCQTGGNQPGPALDVWYRFTASGNQVNINITPGTAPVLQSPAITLWTGSCGGLVGVGCDNNGTAGGNNTALFQPLTPGQVYYIQVSGMNISSAGNFNLSVQATNDCNNCLQVGNLTVSPAPVNGTYLPGTTVNFCYNITQYTQVSSNWLHGVTFNFGAGWNPATIVSNPPASCSGSGTWNWYNSWTSSATSTTWGPGFGYNHNTPVDANPGNNFGDNCSTPNWNFCWSIQTDAVCTGSNTNLNFTINTSGDGESGSWSSIACQGDPNFQFSAVLACCNATAVGTNPTCNGGNNGTATVTPTGTAPFTYLWSNGQTTQTATGLVAGTYTVTVTDNNSCVSTATVTLINPPAMTAPITSTNVTCNGGNNGSATVNPTGSVGPYTYLWSNGQTTPIATGLVVGTYTVTVTSATGCTVTNTVTITQPTPITITTTTVSATCGLLNGSATANPSGGVGPYTYLWSNGQTTQTATGLGVGVYTVTVTGVGGCTTTATTTISSTGSITASATGTNVSCFGGNNGSATATGVGAGPYTYLWSNGQTTQTATGLVAGTYTVTVTSAGCTATATVIITQPTQLTAAITTTNVNCNGGNNGSANVTPNGGVGPYTYSWNTTPIQTTPTAINLIAGTYNVTVTDFNGCTVVSSANITQSTALTLTVGSSTNPTCFGGTNGSITVNGNGGTGSYLYSINSGPNQVSPTFTGLGTGSYTIVVTDVNGCTSNVTTTLTQPTSITATPVITNVTCNGGSNGQITLVVAGGTGPYTYLWSNGGTTNPLTGLTAGTYSVIVTDVNGCTLNLTNLTVTQPSALTINPIATPPTICIGQSSNLTSNPTGGTGPYTYLWTNGATTQNTSVSPLTTTTYTVQVTDANGCNINGSVTVNVNPPLTGGTSASPSTICAGSSTTLTATASGGDGGPYNFTWVPGGSGQTINVNPTNTTTYVVTISDGCGPNITSTVTVTVNPNPNVTFSTTPLSGCQPLTVTYTNTTPGVSNCVWTINGVPTNSCVVTQTFPIQGTYTSTLSVTDVNGCVGTSGGVVTNVYPNPIASFTVTPPIVNILEPLVTFNNISSAGSYQWNFGDGSMTTNVMSPTHVYGDTGTFTVQLIVTTQNGCTDTTYGTVYVSDVFSIYIPNIFTPNSDGKNDTFTPVVTGYDFYEFWIFNRWGEMIYYSTTSGTPWDATYLGKTVQDGVYIWKVHAKEKDNVKHHTLVGHVTVLK